MTTERTKHICSNETAAVASDVLVLQFNTNVIGVVFGRENSGSSDGLGVFTFNQSRRRNDCVF